MDANTDYLHNNTEVTLWTFIWSLYMQP